MELSWVDIAAFIGFMATVVVVSLYAGRKEHSSEDYFLAGRKLTWWLIGFSLIASNISTEHFVGMAGRAFTQTGLAIASYEWMSAITLVIVAWWLLPKFLSVGIYTMPEFLEYRYDHATRAIMATYLLAAYIIVFLATVLYSGATGLNGVFNFGHYLETQYHMSPEDAKHWATVACIWMIGIVAGAYTIYGGLKAVVWSDLLQGGALLLGGALCLWLGLKLLGGGTLIDHGGITGGSILEGWRALVAGATATDPQTGETINRLSVIRPWNDPEVPWLAVFFGGLWIPNLFYWGLNQFITQRTLGAKSLAEGQRGIYLACVFKLIIPFIIVIPGIIAFMVFGDTLLAKTAGDVSKAGEIAYPHLISQIMPPMLRGVMLAALAGAVMSSFNSGLNSASTIFTIDLYAKYFRKNATARQQVGVGRIATTVIVFVACLWAPVISSFEGVFNYIQEIWGFISPGIVAAFLVGLIIKRAPTIAGKTALLLGPVLYAICRVPKWLMDARYTLTAPDGSTTTAVPAGFLTHLYDFSSWAFLHHMGLVFLVLAVIMVLITLAKPRSAPVTYPRSQLDTTVPASSYVLGSLVIATTVALYIVFW